jgi:hypothetical protein
MMQGFPIINKREMDKCTISLSELNLGLHTRIVIINLDAEIETFQVNYDHLKYEYKPIVVLFLYYLFL